MAPAAEQGYEKTCLLVQPKLTIGSPDDPLEDEADAIADKVMRMPEPNFIQRKCAHCEEEEKVQRKPLTSFIQRKESTAGNAASDCISSKINASKGTGNSIDAATRTFMESRFGADFSDVKIHTDDKAMQLNRELNAKAFTVGNDIYFNKSEYGPGSEDGKHLLAHELTHTIQQEKNIRKSVQKKDMEFQPAVVAMQLRDAMKGWGTDEEAVYAALAGRTQEQTEQIAIAYKSLTGRDLQADLTDELTSDELLRLASYGSAPANEDERAMAVAIQLKNAMEGWGTDENAIYVSLQGRSESELGLISTAYEKLTSRKLMSDLQNELTGDELNIAKGTMGISPDVTIRDTELGMLFVGNFDFSLKNCQVAIEVRVKFQFTDDIGEPDRVAFKNKFMTAVSAKWQHSGYKLVGGTSCPCEEIPITINILENDTDYHKIIDVENRSDNDRRPNVMRDMNVNLGTDEFTLQHEFGHVLGLYDEYREQQPLLPIPILGRLIKKVSESFAEAVWHRNRPNDIGSLMNMTGDELRPRFFEHYTRAANETAPFNCNYVVSK